jgi:hypothetical protein
VGHVNGAGAGVTLSLGGMPLLRFGEPPAAAAELLAGTYGRLLGPGDDAPVSIEFRPPPPGTYEAEMATAGVRTLAVDGRRFLLCDGGGRRAELPVAEGDHHLAVDPAFDPRPRGALRQLVDRLVEWRLTAGGMVALEGAAAVVPEGGVALVGFGGSGKSSILAELLAGATAHLADERLVLQGDGLVASFPSPLGLSLGRRYRLAPAAAGGLSRRDRLLLRHLPSAVAALPGPAGARLARSAADRWVTVDVERAFPGVGLPDTAPLDALVFLRPVRGGAVEVVPLPRQELIAGVAHQITYLHRVGLFALEAMFGFGLPAWTPWPLATPPDVDPDRLDGFLAGVDGWVALVPAGAPPAEVAGAIRRAVARGRRRAVDAVVA